MCLKFAKGSSDGRRQVVSFAVGGSCSPVILTSSLFPQVSRIEELTSVTPSMPTTACWILRPTNAGRSLLLTHSGTIGTTSTAFTTKLLSNSCQLPMETRKLICLACHHIHLDEAEILKYPPEAADTTRKRLDHLRFYLKKPSTFCCIGIHKIPFCFHIKSKAFFVDHLAFTEVYPLWVAYLSLRTQGYAVPMHTGILQYHSPMSAFYKQETGNSEEKLDDIVVPKEKSPCI